MTQKLDFAAMPHPQRLQWLAERKKPCEGPDDGDPNGVHPIGCLGGCRGSSVVPLLPGLRHLGWKSGSLAWAADVEHLLLSELAKAGYSAHVGIELYKDKSPAFLANVRIFGCPPNLAEHASDVTCESALSLAACRAVKGEG